MFSGIPPKFLQFNGASVVRRQLNADEMLCQEGEYGSTAFLILSGEFEVFLSTERGKVQSRGAGGIAGFFGGIRTVTEAIGGLAKFAKLASLSGQTIDDEQRIIMNADDVILGEMTCLNGYPRSATVVATQASEVLEIKSNVLYMLQRNAASREVLDKVYRRRTLGQLKSLSILQPLDEVMRNRVADALQSRVELITVEPGQTIFRQGDKADDYYVVRLGFVKISQTCDGQHRVLNYLSPGTGFGEIGLLGKELSQEIGSPIDDIRTATCEALDHVELIRIRGKHFRELVRQFPQVRSAMVQTARELLERNEETQRRFKEVDSLDYLEQGLYLAQSLLVLDLEKCTRCDECTKACADTNGGVTRLIREGLRFDKFMVASSCRSCMDPSCLVGCPVDAIHRSGSSLEIEIEDYCIGCGLCAENCPYGNINMHGFPKQFINDRGKPETLYSIGTDGRRKAVVQQRATTCDLCSSVGGKPSCVYACPHDAAHRMSGPELYQIVSKGDPAAMRR